MAGQRSRSSSSRIAAGLIKQDDHSKRRTKLSLRAQRDNGVDDGPPNIMAALGSGEALIARVSPVSCRSSARQPYGPTAGGVWWLRPSPREPDQVEEWLQHDTGNLTLAVQAVIQAQQHR